ILFKNTDGEKHNVYSPENRFKGIDIPSGKSAILALDATGSYPFVCEYHPNLTGVIMVE
ncbi:MAG: cupredoxin domain-containing protein, partial [Cyanobacteria bacterium NC_groundwater_1444_Ag_S-0.65um_54_12]|nr:cupredoxin domain-containing protein [Cyanobacteria bacterium NC_groundwater_1444_Ag_S-0.65um_54_12]